MTTYLQHRGRVLRCVISTADHGAALNGEAVRQVTRALHQLGPETGAVLLAGEGPSFCTGGEVSAFGAAADPGALVQDMAREFHVFQRAIADAGVPVIAAVVMDAAAKCGRRPGPLHPARQPGAGRGTGPGARPGEHGGPDDQIAAEAERVAVQLAFPREAGRPCAVRLRS